MTNALDLGIRHLLSEQRDDGSWEGEMVWCTMILSQNIIVKRIAGNSFDERSRDQMVKYFRTSRTADGSGASSGIGRLRVLHHACLRRVDSGSER